MRLRPSELQIPDDDPFHFDVLERKQCASTLSQLLKSAEDSLVIGLDADWGQGKTTFLKMWRAQLRKEGCKSILFNAWESDFSESALVSLIGELELGLAALQAGGSKTKQSFQKAKKLGIKLVQRAIPTAIKIATAGVLDLEKEVEGALGDLAEKVAEERIKAYEASKSSMRGFRAALSEFASAVTQRTEGAATYPLVIFVDELDRCRPSYAIDVLETVKHLFSVPGVVFVIAADWSQLAAAAKQRYGADIDVGGYLRRFVDINMALPVPSPERFCQAQFERFGLDAAFKARNHDQTRYDRDHVVDVFNRLFATTGCSLRDQERCFSLLSLAIRSTPQDHLLHALFLASLIVLKVKNPTLYKRYVADPSIYKEVIQYFGTQTPGAKLFRETHGYGAVIEAYMATALPRDWEDRLRGVYVAESSDPKKTESERQRAVAILKIAQEWEFRNAGGTFKYLLDKIDLLASAPR